MIEEGKLAVSERGLVNNAALHDFYAPAQHRTGLTAKPSHRGEVMKGGSEYGGSPGLIQPPPHDPTGAGDRRSVRDAALLLRQQVRAEASSPDHTALSVGHGR